MICLARRAASTTYANWLSGAFVSTVISVIPPQTMPEVFLPGPDAALLYNAAPLQLLALRVLPVPHLHSRRNNHNIFQTPRFHHALSVTAARYLRPNSVRASATAFPAPVAKAAKLKSPPTPVTAASPAKPLAHRSPAPGRVLTFAIPPAISSACHTNACQTRAHIPEIRRGRSWLQIPRPSRNHSTSHSTRSRDAPW